MWRREFLGLLANFAALGAFSGCSAHGSGLASSPRRVPPRLRAICFDLFTLFDPRSVVSVAETVVGDQAAALCDQWRVRQFEYSWLRATARQYIDFEHVTRDALTHAARSRGLTLRSTDFERLVDAYSELEPWPDTRGALEAWHRQGLRLATLANYSPTMIARLMEHSRLTALFDVLISTDAAKTFKPDPRAYALGPAVLGLDRREIVFAAFGGWDAAGASWFGFPTFWVNRLSVTAEVLSPGPTASGNTFAELAAFVVTNGSAVTRRDGSAYEETWK